MTKKIQIYGIKNCDTMKKAFNWFTANNIDYDFNDYKKSGVNEKILQKALNKYGWEKVLNTRGTTWRKLPEAKRHNMNDESAFKIAIENPSILKRPMIPASSKTIFGFDEEIYAETFL